VRIEAGPPGYLPKEQLWDHLDAFADNMLGFLREQDALPNLSTATTPTPATSARA
jgi:sucrose-phosphate synthase